MDSNSFFLRWRNLDKYASFHYFQNTVPNGSSAVFVKPRINMILGPSGALFSNQSFANLYYFDFSRPGQECQKIFPAKNPMNHDDCRQKVTLPSHHPIQIIIYLIQIEGFGWSDLIGVDVNSDNFCGAGIIYTSAQQIGCLYRLEPNKQAKVNQFLSSYVLFNNCFQMYRLTIRTSREGVANRLVELLEDQF